jgi:peptide-methionine (R)-S-oxide reductase
MARTIIKRILIPFISIFIIYGISIAEENTPMTNDKNTTASDELRSKDNSYWKEKLSPEQFSVCREAGTERPFTGKYWDEKRPGMYYCSACGAKLFSSDTKYDSGSGWPSFYDVADKNAVELKRDISHGMIRTEVICKKCGAHLGHVFDDGPKETTGKRYCINSVSLMHEQDKK